MTSNEDTPNPPPSKPKKTPTQYPAPLKHLAVNFGPLMITASSIPCSPETEIQIVFHMGSEQQNGSSISVNVKMKINHKTVKLKKLSDVL